MHRARWQLENSKVQTFENSKNRKFKKSKIRKFRNPSFQDFGLGAQIAENRHRALQTFKNSRIHKFENWKFRKFKNSNIRNFEKNENSKFRKKFENSKIRKFKNKSENSNIQQFKKLKIRKFGNSKTRKIRKFKKSKIQVFTFSGWAHKFRKSGTAHFKHSQIQKIESSKRQNPNFQLFDFYAQTRSRNQTTNPPGLRWGSGGPPRCLATTYLEQV